MPSRHVFLSIARVAIVLVAVAVSALASVALVAGARSASDTGGVIAFTRADGIYVMHADGAGVRPLRRGGVAAQAYDLAWSPDGRRLAFATGSRGIWLMNADGTNLVRLVDTRPGRPQSSSPSWSPDGQRLAYVTFPGSGRVWVMNPDGSDKRLLARLPWLRLYAAAGVDWSSAGGRVAFTTGGWISELYVLNTDGGGLRKLMNGTRFAYQPQWSPDGRRIAFTYAFGASGEEIAVIAADGDTQAQFLTANDVLDSDPAWSADGSRIAFVRGEEEECSLLCPPTRRSTHEIYVMNADGTGVKQLTHNQIGEGSPAWQPSSSS